ncbi:MAG: class I SAM-dependent methyltransferase [Chloroflexi bacterium]|jgi:16S rRNA (guanine1516-N2)-methyltransferase|nr:class I SAM-dependent methyltransferase [Chloroflexota bacterium]
MEQDRNFVVTTSRRASSDIRAQARQKASDWKLPYFDRHDETLVDVTGTFEAVFVYDHDGLGLSIGESNLKFNLGTAALRLQAISRGEPVTLIRVGEIQANDRVLDATLGLGHDSIVAARAVGPKGSVVGIESSWPLFTLISEGLTQYDSGDESSDVQPVFDDSRSYLANADADSFDVVILDPMFSIPKRSDGSFEVLRKFASPAGLDPDWIQMARRVAKRWVVVKTDYEKDWFSSEGLERVPSGGSVNWFRAPASS